MHIEIGTGDRYIIFHNVDKTYDVDNMLTRIAASYKEMLAVGYPDAVKTHRSCRMIFSNEDPVYAGVMINISKRPCGIYIGNSAYDKQIARRFFTMTGWNIHKAESSAKNLEIGIGSLRADTQGFAILKDAMLEIPMWLFEK